MMNLGNESLSLDAGGQIMIIHLNLIILVAMVVILVALMMRIDNDDEPWQ